MLYVMLFGTFPFGVRMSVSGGWKALKRFAETWLQSQAAMFPHESSSPVAAQWWCRPYKLWVP
jgi:hypothetical protein